MASNNPFNLEDLFGGLKPRQEPEKGRVVRGRKMCGNQYVRAADILNYLEANDVKLPALTGMLKKGSANDAS